MSSYFGLKYWIITGLTWGTCLLLEGQIPQKMVIWERPNLEVEESVPVYTEFNERGQKTRVYTDRALPLEVYDYDSKGRILKASIRGSFSDDSVTEYEYRKGNVVIRHTEYSSFQEAKRWVTYRYLNEKGQVKEEKQYANIGGELSLEEWKQFEYNEMDSLLEERSLPIEVVHKDYTLPDIATRYYYRSEDGQLEQITFYDEGKLVGITHLYYDGEGKLTIESYEDFVYGHAWHSKSYAYKNGQLWKVILSNIYEREEKVYLEGRLIRVKRYDNSKITPELEYVGDYQYLE